MTVCGKRLFKIITQKYSIFKNNMHQYSLSKHIHCIYCHWNYKTNKFSCAVFAGGDRYQVELSFIHWPANHLIMCVNFHESHGNVRDSKGNSLNFSRSFFPSLHLRTKKKSQRTQNALTQLTVIFFPTLPVHFRNQKEMAYGVYTRQYEKYAGEIIAFLQSFFSRALLVIRKKKNLSVYVAHQNVCGETHERNEKLRRKWKCDFFFLSFRWKCKGKTNNNSHAHTALCVPRKKKIKWEEKVEECSPPTNCGL